MAVVAPMPVTTHTPGSFSSYHNQDRRRSSDIGMDLGRSISSGNANRPPLTTLEDIAAQIQLRLSTSPPSADFSYLDGKVYGESSSGNRMKSRSLPNLFRNQKKSNLSSKLPFRKSKSVRFADTQGLPLVVAVHQLTNKDSSYTANKIVPYDDQGDILSGQPLLAAAPEAERKDSKLGYPSNPTAPKTLPPRNISPAKTPRRQNSPPLKHKHVFAFTQPSLEPDFFERVHRDSVVLESIREEPRSLHGIVRVSNLAFSKEIIIRWTHDGWRTSHDTACFFCSNDGNTDRFAFELPINGDDVSFAIRYRVEGAEYWDSNKGANYTVTSRP